MRKNNKMNEAIKHKISVAQKRNWRLKRKREAKQQELRFVSPEPTPTEPTTNPTCIVIAWNETEDLIRIGDQKWIGTKVNVTKVKTRGSELGK